MSAHLQYTSYLIRLWRLPDQTGTPVEWQSEIQHIQSGKRWNFNNLEELEAFLHRRILEQGADSRKVTSVQKAK